MKLANRVALVTGGGVRLGQAIALGLAQRGVRVAITYNSSAAAAEETVSRIEAAGSEALALQADFRRGVDMDALIGQIKERFGKLEILVNNAAIFEPGNWDDTTEENWEQHFAINLKAPFFLSQAFARQLGKDRSGHIVNIADWRGVRPSAGYIAYTLTKAGLIAMTQSLALALAPNIQVNAIAPGMILPPPGKDQTYLERMAARIPAQRIGSPEEIVRAVLYLVESDFVSGELLYVTGAEHL